MLNHVVPFAEPCTSIVTVGVAPTAVVISRMAGSRPPGRRSTMVVDAPLPVSRADRGGEAAAADGPDSGHGLERGSDEAGPGDLLLAAGVAAEAVREVAGQHQPDRQLGGPGLFSP